jgi:hypothetical protein
MKTINQKKRKFPYKVPYPTFCVSCAQYKECKKKFEQPKHCNERVPV